MEGLAGGVNHTRAVWNRPTADGSREALAVPILFLAFAGTADANGFLFKAVKECFSIARGTQNRRWWVSPAPA